MKLIVANSGRFRSFKCLNYFVMGLFKMRKYIYNIKIIQISTNIRGRDSNTIKCVDSTPTLKFIPEAIRQIHTPHHGHKKSRTWSWMIHLHPFHSIPIAAHPHPTHIHSWEKAISNFEILKFNVKALDVKVHIVDPVSSRCISFSFRVNWNNHYIDMANKMFDIEKAYHNYWNKKSQIKVFPTELFRHLIKW